MRYRQDNMGNIFTEFQQIISAKTIENTPKWYQNLTKGFVTTAEILQKAPLTTEIIEKGQEAVKTQASMENWIKSPLTIAAGALILILLLKK